MTDYFKNILLAALTLIYDVCFISGCRTNYGVSVLKLNFIEFIKDFAWIKVRVIFLIIIFEVFELKSDLFMTGLNSNLYQSNKNKSK